MTDDAHNKNAALADAGDSVLLLIDIQTQLTAAMPGKVLARLQKNAAMLAAAAQKLAAPVFITEREPARMGAAETDIQKLLPATAKQYEKPGFSCASAADFMEDLAATGRKQVVLTGMEAHVCILQTALDLLHHGYAVFVAADTVCSRQRDNYETALRRLGRAGVIICDAESVLFEWLRGADPETSLAVQALAR